MATGVFTGETASGSQDLVFDHSGSICLGQVYVASYYSPTANYSAVNDYFDSEVTTGPVTAIAGVGAEVNGVFRYSDVTVYPNMSFRNSNYWVTPLWSTSVEPKAALNGIVGALENLIDTDASSDLADKLEDVVDKLKKACEELEKDLADVRGCCGCARRRSGGSRGRDRRRPLR